VKYPLIIDGPYKGRYMAVPDSAHRIAFVEPSDFALSGFDTIIADQPALPEIRYYYFHRYSIFGREILIASVEPVSLFSRQPLPARIENAMFEALVSDLGKMAVARRI
jgi:hypothetical protein